MPKDRNPKKPFGPIKLDPELFDAVERRRGKLNLNKQQVGRRALRQWLSLPEPNVGAVPLGAFERAREANKAISRALVGPAHYVWWATERVRRQTNYRLPEGAPAYLKEGLRQLMQLASRPRGRVWNHTGDDVPTPDLEKLSGGNPRARWLWDESPAGLVVRAADLHHLERMPGVITSLVVRTTDSRGHECEPYAEVGP